MSTCTALIVAAGRGSRFGGPLPKQYALLGAHPVLRHTIATLRATPGIDGILVVIGAGDEDLYQKATMGLDLPPPVLGGATRQASVLNGLESLAGQPPELVAIHDAARPFVNAGDIQACLAAVGKPGTDGAVLGVAVADTLKRVTPDGSIAETVPRTNLWRAQTPQIFRFAALLQAHRDAASLGTAEATALTDDSAVAEGAGPENLLVTLGYAGWGAGQLESELAQNAWLTVQADSRIIFGVPPEQRYPAALRLLGIDPVMLAGVAGHA